MADQHDNVSTFQEEGISWFPTHLLHQEKMRSQRQHGHRHRLKSPAATEPLPSKCSSKPQQRSTRYPKNWAAGGPGMQAIFLDSKQKSCGTGVFLPQRTGTDFQFTNKPACSSVLLPARVVEALNLNVHELCSQIKPRDVKKKSKESSNNNDVVGNKKRQSCVISQSQKRSSSPDIFLPKEWTY